MKGRSRFLQCLVNIWPLPRLRRGKSIRRKRRRLLGWYIYFDGYIVLCTSFDTAGTTHDAIMGGNEPARLKKILGQGPSTAMWSRFRRWCHLIRWSFSPWRWREYHRAETWKVGNKTYFYCV